MPALARTFLILVLLFSTSGCSRAYYSTMEKLGYQKRDILVDRVESAQSSQAEAKKQFRSALEKFRSLVNIEAGSLESKYDELRSELDRSEAGAKKVSSRIQSVQDVAEDLFDEWEDELTKYKSASLRSKSQSALRETKRQYQPMIQAMKQAEKSMEPVLETYRDQVLYLKHNLNARAISSLRQELQVVESDVNALIEEMEASIDKASQFIKGIEKS